MAEKIRHYFTIFRPLGRGLKRVEDAFVPPLLGVLLGGFLPLSKCGGKGGEGKSSQFPSDSPIGRGPCAAGAAGVEKQIGEGLTTPCLSHNLKTGRGRMPTRFAVNPQRKSGKNPDAWTKFSSFHSDRPSKRGSFLLKKNPRVVILGEKQGDGYFLFFSSSFGPVLPRAHRKGAAVVV